MSFGKRHGLWASWAVLISVAVPAHAAEPVQESANRPNIVLCMTDDQGWGDVSYNGLKKIRTPNLDAMAAAGLRFDRFYAAHPSCSPTRASVMTGRHPYRMNCLWPGMKLRKEEITIAQAVKQAGYRSGHFGKWHLNGVSGPGKIISNSDPFSPLNVGFDESFSVSNYFEPNWTFGHNGVPEKTSGDGSDVIVAQALKFMGEAVEKKQPFLAVVWFGSPHVPHNPLPEDRKAAGGSGYYGEIIGVDRGMGTLRAGLRKLGIAENTLLCFCSDNGSWLDENAPDAHGSNGVLRGKKGELWEGGIRVPGIIEWPVRIKRPSVTNVVACTSDLYPTIVDLLKIKVPNQVQPLDGISLVPLIDGQMKQRPSPIGFWHFGPTSLEDGPAVWNDNQYKLHRRDPGKYELYDLTTDLSEKHDIAAAHPEIVARMKRELEQWLKSVMRSNQGEDYRHAWKHFGSLYVLTTPDGANLPAKVTLKDFPLLVRLDKDFFDFSQAKQHGEDLRFSLPGGDSLPYQVEEWDPAKGVASIWVRMPVIKGNARQEIRLHWGNPDAESESSGKAVFNETNGYLSVWHMTHPVKDETGKLQSVDRGTTDTDGMVGPARHFPGQHGIFCGDKIVGYPEGSSPSTTEAWLKSDVANGRVLGWGNEQAQGKVILNYRSPPHIRMECYFSGADVIGKSAVPRSQWVHVVHTYQKGQSLLYVNGVLDGVTKTDGAPLNIRTPARMWIGGWYDVYDFAGDVDEVRISNVIRSADWARLQYENQKPLQTLTGHVVQPGKLLEVAPAQATVTEGQSVSFTAQAGGAQKLYWILKRDGQETVVATDRFHFTLPAGRVSGDQTWTLQLKAIYADGMKTREIPIAIKEAIADPQFTLRAPTAWDGRATIEVIPQVSNLKDLEAQRAGPVLCTWKLSDFAVTNEVLSDKLRLLRAQNSGTLHVTATMSNGGTPISQTVEIAVTEPEKDAWVIRTPDKDEKPVDNQFYARDDTNEAALYYNGKLDQPADSVFLKLYADDQLVKTEKGQLDADKSYALTAKLKPGLIVYKVEFGSISDGQETLLKTVNNLVCGDAYLIEGQSNAVATDWGSAQPPEFKSNWIRTFGHMWGSPQKEGVWGSATYRADREKLQIGYWGMELAKRLVEGQKIPICIINGAVGGTRIDQHQRNAKKSTDMSTIYGRMLWRVQAARLTHGIRGVLWHQGESDQGSDGPTGGYGYEDYRRYFLDMAAAWKQDFPNIQHYYLFQIWPKSCAMGHHGSDNHLREVQRNLPTAFSRMSIMSTLGIKPPGGCHYPPEGYKQIAMAVAPLVERDNYGQVSVAPITPANLKRASYASDAKTEIVLEFDQAVAWDDKLTSQFYLDKKPGQIASGSATGNRILLKLKGPATASKIAYLDSASWSPDNLLYGANGIAALTFCDVPILP